MTTHTPYTARIGPRQEPTTYCQQCGKPWPCDVRLAVLEERERIAGAVGELEHDAICAARPWAPIGPCDCNLSAILAIVREDSRG